MIAEQASPPFDILVTWLALVLLLSSGRAAVRALLNASPSPSAAC